MGGYFPIGLVLMRDGLNKVNLLEEFILIALKNYHQKLFKSNDSLFRNLIFAQSNQLHNWGLEESLVVIWQNLIVLIFNLKLRKNSGEASHVSLRMFEKYKVLLSHLQATRWLLEHYLENWLSCWLREVLNRHFRNDMAHDPNHWSQNDSFFALLLFVFPLAIRERFPNVCI